jgi:DNA (cytosine-5)-methyltransferase 1
VTQGRPVFLLWASPDCRHHSKAKGGKPVSRSVRGLADVVILWAKVARPQVIALENVEDFQDWGPLTDAGRPCPNGKGLEFHRWVRALEAEGYAVEWRELRANWFGTPTIRKRLFCRRPPRRQADRLAGTVARPGAWSGAVSHCGRDHRLVLFERRQSS